MYLNAIHMALDARQARLPPLLLGPQIWAFCLEVSWSATYRVRSRIAIVLTHIEGLKAPLATSHELPSSFWYGISALLGGILGGFGVRSWGSQDSAGQHVKKAGRLWLWGSRFRALGL